MDFITAHRWPQEASDSGDLDRDLLTALGEDERDLNVGTLLLQSSLQEACMLHGAGLFML
jgi:hypothetical protein